MRWLVVLVLAASGCGLGAGMVALRGASMKTSTYQTGNDCQTTSTAVYDFRGQQTGTQQHTTCASLNAPETHTYNPNWMHFGALIGIKEGYAWGSYAAGSNVGAPTGSTSGRTIEPYFDFNFQFGRFGLALEYGWAGHNLDPDMKLNGLSYGAWPLGVLAMVAAGPFTVFAGVDELTAASLQNNGAIDLDLGGYRLVGGFKLGGISVWDDKIDLYPRVELQSTHASADGGVRYSGTSLDMTIEMGF